VERKPDKKPLRLSRMTIRRLTERETNAVVGGASANLYNTCRCTLVMTCKPHDEPPYSACCGAGTT
jgi:hypothetical protein